MRRWFVPWLICASVLLASYVLAWSGVWLILRVTTTENVTLRVLLNDGSSVEVGERGGQAVFWGGPGGDMTFLRWTPAQGASRTYLLVGGGDGRAEGVELRSDAAQQRLWVVEDSQTILGSWDRSTDQFLHINTLSVNPMIPLERQEDFNNGYFRHPDWATPTGGVSLGRAERPGYRREQRPPADLG